jgi:riboflavin kinase/FMN adenylyltransferase
VVAPERSPKLLTSPDRRAELMQEESIDQVLILPFTLARASLTAEDFIRTIVAGRLGARAVLVGHNFRFGYQHAGNVALLEKLGREFGFETIIVPAVAYRGRVVSSSGIRELILHGKVSLAARLLQSGYAMEGSVVAGRGVGSKQTVPTLNLATAAELIPARGVYITHTRDLESPREWNSVTNIGYRPTFGSSDELSIETFLLDPIEGEQPRHIRVEFLRRIRDEKRFESPEALRAQILKDARAAQSYFRRVKNWIGRVPCISS